MHPAYIAAGLEMAGYSQAALARELKVSPQAVYTVVRGTGRNRRVEQRIAELTGLALAELWPQWHCDEPARGLPPSQIADALRAAAR
ncbi:MAG: helix-turn-helix domain-containing protein [Rhodanobacter sp.]